MLTPPPPADERARLDPARLFASLANAKGVLLAVSGGPDSMALTLLAADWAAQAKTPPLRVATVDHGLRSESGDEAAKVALWAASLGLPHETLVWTGEKPAAALQERAREARYALLIEAARRGGCDVIVTAHHADDQAETILFRLLRGSGLDGLSGMEPTSERSGLTLARPLLALGKAELVALCRARGQDFIDDPSNADPRFARTRLRALARDLAREGLDPEGWARLGRRAARASEALEARAAAVLSEIAATRSEAAFACAFAPLAAEPLDILIRAIGREIARLSGAQPRLERLERLCETLAEAHRQGAPLASTLAGTLVRLDGSGRLTLRREGERRRGRT